MTAVRKERKSKEGEIKKNVEKKNRGNEKTALPKTTSNSTLQQAGL